ncbi:MAG TPA: hypothetical protein VMF61_04450 [Candidatus Acidoferrales bacterium]|nr:hypothetical protein [Candidatus Acidoferrales bacterium]
MKSFLQPSADDFCPCGGTKRWAKCHGLETCSLPPIAESPLVDSTLVALGQTILEVLKDSIEVVTIDETSVEDVFRKRTLLYFAKKVYRVTLAGITLIRTGQSMQAFTDKRGQHYAWVAFQYYTANERASILFFASGPLRQRDKAKEVMDFSPTTASDPKRQSQLANLKELAGIAYERFPDLLVPKGKSAQSSQPAYRDWKEPDEHEMLESLIEQWPDEMAKLGTPISGDVNEWRRQQLRSAHFYHSSFPSQDVHATPLGLISELNAQEDQGENSAGIPIDTVDPNALLFIYLPYPLGTAGKLVELSNATGFTDRFIKARKALERFREYLDA